MIRAPAKPRAKCKYWTAAGNTMEFSGDISGALTTGFFCLNADERAQLLTVLSGAHERMLGQETESACRSHERTETRP